VTPAAVDYLLAPHLPAIDSAPILQRLANMHFARKESGRFYLHPVDREFAFGLIAKEITAESQSSQRKPLKNSALSASLRLDSFTQHDLTSRAADYFRQARKPRAEWKKLDDLSAQLAEFDLRYAAGDYDTAADVLAEIDFDYLLLWGHNRLIIELHEVIEGKIQDTNLRLGNLNGLGIAYALIGLVRKAIIYLEKGAVVAREVKDRKWEGVFLGGIGNRYLALGDTRKTIEYYEQSLVIHRETGDRKNEGANLSGLGIAYAELGDALKAIDFLEQALVIDHEIGDFRGENSDLGNIAIIKFNSGNSQEAVDYLEKGLAIAKNIGDKAGQCSHLGNIGEALVDLGKYKEAINHHKQAQYLAKEMEYVIALQYNICGIVQVYLFQNDLVNARATIEAALQYDVPENNHNVSALHGIIALRQGEEVAARGAFVRAIGQADEILSKTAEFYSALDAKGLAICGLAICGEDGGRKTVDGGSENLDDGQRSTVYRQQAIETFRKARQVAPHAGVVKSVLRLFDELVKCDKDGTLKDVRKAAEGK
jgi:tetratricopeptide (TPR) repeat protein